MCITTSPLNAVGWSADNACTVLSVWTLCVKCVVAIE